MLTDDNIDAFVLGTINAPYKKLIDASALVSGLVSGNMGGYTPHFAAFFTEVSTGVAHQFAELHQVPEQCLVSTYLKLKEQTGEWSPAFEAQHAELGTAA